jgi:hypothetical protein
MSGAPIPDVRHSAPFIDILLKSNCTETPGFQDVHTVVYPTILSPQHKGAQPTLAASDVNSSELLTTPAPTDLNSYYFYKVRVSTSKCHSVFTLFRFVSTINQSAIRK